MKPVVLKVTRIGNSRGVRLPAAALARYGVKSELIMEERSDGLLLRPPGSPKPKLSWVETARAIAAEREDWSVWESTAADGLESSPWERKGPRRVAEAESAYEAPRRSRKP